MKPDLSGLLISRTNQDKITKLATPPAQAILLSGQVGIGKTIITNRIVGTWLQIDPEKVPDSQYVRIVSPEKEVITIEQVRSLRQFVQLKESRSGAFKRVIIMQDADKMTVPAQNAFLKLLEEPPAGVAVLLTSSNDRKLLPTIRSRVQLVYLHVPTENEATTFFAANGAQPADISRAYAMTDGSVAQMSVLLSGESDESSTLATAKRILQSTKYERLCMVDQELKDKAVAHEVVRTLAQLASAALKKSNQPAKIAQWYRVLRACTVADEALSANASTKLSLTELMLSL